MEKLVSEEITLQGKQLTELDTTGQSLGEKEKDRRLGGKTGEEFKKTRGREEGG